MKPISFLTLLVVAVSLSGCYHASISTGRTAGTDIVENKWASGWVYGLVPPKLMDVSSQCTDGVALVETKLSFLNQLVSGLTMGIYTPMHIKVTCASGSMSSSVVDITVPADASAEAIQSALGNAADIASESGDPVYMRFE